MNKITTGIDIGTHQVKVVIAERADDPRHPPRILGTGYAESRGLKNGYITSVPDVTRSVGAAVAQASRAAHFKVKRAYVSIGGVGLEEALARGEAIVERGNSEITERDIPRAIAASEKSLPPAATLNRRILHTIPLRYSVDGTRIMGGNPAGMKGVRIAVETLFITCLTRHVDDVVAAVEGAGVEVEDMVAAPIAASFVALSKMQKRLGSVLVIIGAETLSTVVFEDETPLSLKVFPMGGAHITNDLALALRVPPEEAELIKQGGPLPVDVPKKKIDDITARRLTEMFKLVETQLKKIHKDELLPAGVVLAGGSAHLPMTIDLAKSTLRLPSRMALFTESAWAVAYGLTLWGFSGGDEPVRNETSSLKELLHQVWRWVKSFLP